MNKIIYLAALGLLAPTPIAAGVPFRRANTTKQCVQLEVPIPVIATNDHYIMPRVDSNIDAIDWTVNVSTWSTASATARITGQVPVDSTFSIYAQLCVPSQNGIKADILQIATAGNGFDSQYWDVEINPEEYSYLNAAINEGYSVLTWDRIGTGKSEKPDAYDIVQLSTETEILAGLTRLARSGKLISSSKVLHAISSEAAVHDFRPSKVVHVGHSFGSLLTISMLATYGNLSDGAILTGFVITSQSGKVDVAHFDHDFAREQDPVRFGDYPSGYFVLTTESDLQKLYFRKGGFEPELLTYTNTIKQPEAVGLYASGDSYGFPPANEYTGPIQVFFGEFDFLNCDGNCTSLYNATATGQLFPHASDITPYMQPNTGHAVTLATNASAGYQAVFQYLGSMKL